MTDKCYVCQKEFEDDEDPIEIMKGKYMVHEDCFVCSQCKAPLDKYFMKEKKLMCKECACPKCKECGKSIEGKIIRVDEDRYHPDCFKCPLCHAVIGAKDYKIRDKQVMCLECAAKPVEN
ncbi:hypothetical protein EIN_058010 [Entamoeba invadens IP1]|uniref:hypothetical protein n=1 Tax=Entamoeba invadens IP1 TaxID=370355 RepID=UPI0002C3EE70|nr:hypothetical protein EIN_058010 [Entamoeba invadens IP1]ELP93386.1 hypothetical protein EIN_058010 [Entamoeba invadens IP1]|eukprot:XP_004260157.1 hypothetical protein EIN_058010 [Entamoeba invadens IP1]